jgi:hypothetical protein
MLRVSVWGFRLCVALTIAILAQVPGSSFAAWQPNGSQLGTIGSVLAGDAQGGAFVVDGGSYDLTGLISRFDHEGDVAPGWPASGLELDPGNLFWVHASIGAIRSLPDGHGGVYVLAFERGPYPGSGGFLNAFQIYLHRRTSTGQVAPGWQVEGVPIETIWLWPPFSATNLPTMVPDGQDGILITWADSWEEGRALYAQRVRGDGAKLWGDDGVMFRTSTNVGSLPSICSDGRGGALVFWAEWDESAHVGIRGQHLSSSGGELWGPAGRTVSTGAYTALEQSFPPSVSLNFSPHSPAIFAVPDGEGDALLAWSGVTDGDLQVFATRVSRDGGLPWNEDLRVCPASGNQSQLTCSPASGKGIVVAWQDHRDPSAPGIFAQALGFTGRTRWSEEGVPVATGPGDRGSPLVHDAGAGSIFIAWGEAASGGTLRMQRLLTSGRTAPGWPDNGMQVSATAHPYEGVPIGRLGLQVIDAGRSAVIVAWNDVRGAPSPAFRMLGMLVGPRGPEGALLPAVTWDSAATPQDRTRNDDGQFFLRTAPAAASATTGVVEFHAPAGEPATIELLDIQGRRLFARDVSGATSGIQRLRIADAINLPAGVYFARLQQRQRHATARVVVFH